MSQLALTPPSATHQQEFSISKRTSSLPQAFLPKWTKVAADYIFERKKREREEEGRKGGEKGLWDSNNYYSSVALRWQNVALMCVHPATAEPESPHPWLH